MLLGLFLGSAAAVLFLTGGYLFFLALVRRSPEAPRERPAPAGTSLAFVVPTLNEAGLVAAKLADLARWEGPGQAPPIVVVDGGSVDATPDIVTRAARSDARVELASLPHARSKADQINHVLRTRKEEVLVVSDVDTRLESGCVPALLAALASDPGTAIAGAVVRPESRLPEERLHWRIVNRLWWLEGEAASATGLSGVCYAVRRAAAAAIEDDAVAEDARLALAAGSRGLRVRIVPGAVATELRVPQDERSFVAYRRRRGAALAGEWRRAWPSSAPRRLRFLCAARRLQIALVPPLLALTGVLGVALLATADAWWIAVVASALGLVAVWAARPVPGTPHEPLGGALPLAAIRLALLLVTALLGGLREEPAKERVGCSEPVI